MNSEIREPLNNLGFTIFKMDIQPVDNKAITYRVQAIFEGDEPCNATAYATTPNGTQYAVCTTIQYGYKPSSNSTWLTVEPQATQVMTSKKTPEEVQAEAEEAGGLQTWHELSWWYPWYRLHVQINMNGALIHVGFNPILPGGEIVEASNLGNFTVPINSDPTIPLEELARSVQEMIESSIVDVLGLAAITFAAGNIRFPPIIAIALFAYCSGLLLLGNHGVNLYNAGSENAGKAFMAGIAIGLAAVLLTTILGMAFFSGATITLTNVIFAMIGALVGNLYDPAPLMDFTRAIITASLAAIAVSAIALRIPEPIGNLFYCLFLIITSTAMCISTYMAETM